MHLEAKLLDFDDKTSRSDVMMDAISQLCTVQPEQVVLVWCRVGQLVILTDEVYLNCPRIVL